MPSPSEIDALGDYTNSQIVKVYRWGIVNNAAGQTRMINGRSVTFPSTDQMMRVIDWLQEQDNVDEVGGGFALLEYGERQ